MEPVIDSVYIPKKINIRKNKPTIKPLLDIPVPDKIDITSIITDTAKVVTNPIGAAIDVGVSVVSDAATKVVDNFKGFRIENLPRHEEDFALKWFYNNQSTLVPENITIEFNAYLQSLQELKEGVIKLPEGFDGPTLVHDINTYIMKDFRQANQKYDPTDNLIHRAWYAHCAKRAIDSLRQGQFLGEDGYIKKYPQISDIIERRIDEIIVENSLFKKNG